jgi:hypothetical protein
MYYGFKQLMTDIMDLYYGNYSAFTWDFVILKWQSKIMPKTPTFAENWPKSGPYYYGYDGRLRILQNFFITKHFG